MAEITARGLAFHVQRLSPERADQGTAVFLHGLVMDNLSSWFFTAAPRAARHVQVLLYDLRGHGRSARPPTGYGVADHVADLIAILDAVGLAGPVHLVGNSFGGLLGLATALAHPDRVASLVLVDAHVSDAGFGADMATTLGLTGQARDLKIAASFKDWLGRHSTRKRNRLAQAAQALVEGTSLVADLRASAPFGEAALRGIRCPTLALYGESSDIVARGQELAAWLPRCTLHILPGCSHSVIWEATDTVNGAIEAWLVAHSAGEGAL